MNDVQHNEIHELNNAVHMLLARLGTEPFGYNYFQSGSPRTPGLRQALNLARKLAQNDDPRQSWHLQTIIELYMTMLNLEWFDFGGAVRHVDNAKRYVASCTDCRLVLTVRVMEGRVAYHRYDYEDALIILADVRRRIPYEREQLRVRQLNRNDDEIHAYLDTLDTLAERLLEDARHRLVDMMDGFTRPHEQGGGGGDPAADAAPPPDDDQPPEPEQPPLPPRIAPDLTSRRR